MQSSVIVTRSDALYAAAFVAEFNRLHDAGLHAHFCDHPGDKVKAWEAWCADTALDIARSTLKLHNQAVRRSRRTS
jgi:hypothetical protein